MNRARCFEKITKDEEYEKCLPLRLSSSVVSIRKQFTIYIVAFNLSAQA